jgi:hypothetical protein
MSKPNPGSDEARALGCRCPVLDNHYGEGAYEGPDGVEFWTSQECPLHGSALMPKDPVTIDMFGASNG